MIYVIHGDDQVKTRQELHEHIERAKKAGFTDVVRLDGKSLDFTALMQNMESLSFFEAPKRLVVIEDLHKMRSKTELSKIVDYLNSPEATNAHCILWESKTITALQVKKFPTAKVVTVKTSEIIFTLTDALQPKQPLTKILPLLHQACAAESEELVLIMMARQIRLMIQSFDLGFKMAPWQVAKIKKAAEGFGLDTLISMHHDLHSIDVRNKSGQLSTTLESELAFWLSKLYS